MTFKEQLEKAAKDYTKTELNWHPNKAFQAGATWALNSEAVRGMRAALKEITAYCNEELAQVCPNADCDYQAISAIRSVNVCDSALSAYESAVSEGGE